MKLFESLSAPILKTYPELAEDDLPFGPAPKLALGDVALPAFLAARKLKTPPQQLATEIAASVAFGPEVVAAEAAGPYLNFKLDRDRFSRQVTESVLRESALYGSNRTGAGRKLLIEHTSINPNASPHVGRARNAMFGDSLTRLFRFEGYHPTVHYYVNDIGRQIGLLVLHAENVSDMSFAEILQAYVEANRRAEEDPAFSEAGYELLAKMEQGDRETRERFTRVVDICLEGQLAVLARLNIHYDAFDRESQFLQDPRLDAVIKALEEKQAVFTDEDGRLVVDLAKIGHERDEGRYFVLKRANGSSMYGFRDLAYTIHKAEQSPDVNLWVLGEDHKLYAEQVTRILRAADKQVPEPIFYAYILLKEGKMSTRQGKVVLLSDFLDEAASRAAEKVEAQCKDLPAEERREIAQKVAISAVRFAILRVNPNKNVIFDWESSLSFTGDTGPYVQYSCARINSILRKFGELPTSVPDAFPVHEDAEWSLLMKLAAFPDAISAAVAERNPAPVAQFALDTAREFTTFYHECPVLTADSEDKKLARILVCAATLQTLTNALGVLGIEALERM